MRRSGGKKFTNIVIVPNVEKPDEPVKNFSFRDVVDMPQINNETPDILTSLTQGAKDSIINMGCQGKLRGWRYDNSPVKVIEKKKKRQHTPVLGRNIALSCRGTGYEPTKQEKKASGMFSPLSVKLYNFEEK